jgi:hypothetical protein
MATDPLPVTLVISESQSNLIALLVGAAVVFGVAAFVAHFGRRGPRV